MDLMTPTTIESVAWEGVPKTAETARAIGRKPMMSVEAVISTAPSRTRTA